LSGILAAATIFHPSHEGEEPMHRISLAVSLSCAAITLLTMATPFAVPAARAAETAAATLPDDVPTAVRQLIDAANAGDGGAVAALYAEDGAHEDVPAGVVAQGAEEIAAFVDGLNDQFRNLRLEPLTARHAGDLATLEYIFSGVDPESGRSFAVRGVLVFELDGDLIRRSIDFYDRATVLEQLGLVEIPEGA
jgi:steroid delta-isomerase-like uncharacterized protein